MVIRFDKTEKITVKEGTIWDYPISPDLGVSYQELGSRGPSQGQYLNKVCHEVYFIISGSATFTVKGKKYNVCEKDVVVIPENTPHFIETTDLKYITITRPDWYEGQYEEVK